MRRLLRGAAGQSLVEFSLVGLIFVGIVLGIIEGGRAVWNYNTLAQATREGARYAVVHGSRAADPSGPGSSHYTAPDQDEKVEEAVKRFASGLNGDDVEVSAVWLDGTNDRGAEVRITVHYQFRSVASYFGIPSVIMTSSTTMKVTY